MGPGYTSLVWTLPNAVIPKVLKLEPKAFATLVNTAFRNPLTDVEFLLSQISDETGQPLVDFEAESSWGRSSSSNTSSSFPCPPEILQVQEGSRAAFPLRLRNAEYYAAQRVALVGDAAHSIHPLAGQGLNLGLADAQALCSVLAKASENGSDLGTDFFLIIGYDAHMICT